MDPVTMALLPALLKGGVGLIQGGAGAAGMFGLRRPQYRIPTAATESLGVARELAGRMEMPGESAARAAINQQTANAYGQAQQYGMAGLASLPAIMGQQQSGELNLAAQAAGWRTQQQQNLMGALSEYAQYQDQAWQMNKFAPYQDKLQRYQNLIGAGAQNLMGGADTAMMTMLGMPELFQGGGVTASKSDAEASSMGPTKPLALPGLSKGVASMNNEPLQLPQGIQMPWPGAVISPYLRMRLPGNWNMTPKPAQPATPPTSQPMGGAVGSSGNRPSFTIGETPPHMIAWQILRKFFNL